MDREELLSLGIDEEIADKILAEREGMRQEYERELESVRRDYETERLLSECGARSVRAVKALIDLTSEEEVSEQINRLKNSEETRFLFEGKQSFKPMRKSDRLPDTKKPDYETQLRKARENGDTVGAIKIKKKAAEEGIFLM